MKYAIAALTLAAFTGMGFAQNSPAPVTTPAPAAAAAKPAVKKHEMKKHEMKADVTAGEITSVDAAKNMITVKTRKGEVKSFTLDSVGTLAQGAKVKVMVKDGKTSVKEIKEHKVKHEGKKKMMKKAEAPKPEAGK